MNKKRSSGARSPSGAPDRRSSAPQRGVQTLTFGTPTAPARPPASPPVEAGWKRRARALHQALGEVIARPSVTPDEVARVERALLAWELGGHGHEVVGRVARLVDRAYVALHDSSGPPAEIALQSCAHVLYKGIPRPVQDSINYAQVLLLVRWLAQQPEHWPAVVRASSDLLGWTGPALTHAGDAIRVAMAYKPIS